MGMAVEISFLSCKQAKICVILYLLPVVGRHPEFTSYPGVGQYICTSPVVTPDPENIGIAVGILSIYCIEAEI